MAKTALQEVSDATTQSAPREAALEFSIGREVQNGDITQNGQPWTNLRNLRAVSPRRTRNSRIQYLTV
jgi:hypothetical protein